MTVQPIVLVIRAIDLGQWGKTGGGVEGEEKFQVPAFVWLDIWHLLDKYLL